jgi:flagellar biosynthesis/type III secretory pathway chaperone
VKRDPAVHPTHLSDAEGVLDRFIELLEREQAALIVGHSDHIADYAEKKSQLTSELDAEKALQDALDREGARHPLYKKVAKARELNAINGTLIKDQLLRLRGALKRFQALSPSGPTPSLYGRDGEEQSPRSRTLGVA